MTIIRNILPQSRDLDNALLIQSSVMTILKVIGGSITPPTTSNNVVYSYTPATGKTFILVALQQMLGIFSTQNNGRIYLRNNGTVIFDLSEGQDYPDREMLEQIVGNGALTFDFYYTVNDTGGYGTNMIYNLRWKCIIQ